MKQKPVLRLEGELRLHGADWTIPELRNLFEKLGNIIGKDDKVFRYMRYFGESDGRTEIRCFGVETEAKKIPDGMVALELGEDSITMFKPVNGKPSKVWSEQLTWNWLDRSVSGAPVGDFKARVPDDWTTRQDAQPVDFIMATNMYYENGRPYDEEIHLVEYDPAWPEKYEEMAAWLRKNVPPETLISLEHIGSTAIPGLTAKPVIDIALETPSLYEARRVLIPLFNKPECEYWIMDGYLDFYIRREFMGTRTHHIHAFASVSDFGKRRVAFRDYLRTHPDDAARYAALKYELAGRNATDREAYTDSKGTFINEITDKALREAERGA